MEDEGGVCIWLCHLKALTPGMLRVNVSITKTAEIKQLQDNCNQCFDEDVLMKTYAQVILYVYRPVYACCRCIHKGFGASRTKNKFPRRTKIIPLSIFETPPTH